MLNEILIRLDDTGEVPLGIRGLDGDGKIVPLTASAFAKFAPAINGAALARVGELESELAAKTAEIAANAQAVADAQAVLMTEDEKKAVALESQLAAVTAQLSVLRAPKVAAGAASVKG